MPNWNTKTIIDDLTHIVGVESITNNGADGEIDTDQLALLLAGTDGQRLFIRGFDPDIEVFDPSNENVSMVELNDGLSSRGGLNSHDFRVARAFIDVRQYFINRGFEVVDSLEECF